jgi:hypothetical protein
MQKTSHDLIRKTIPGARFRVQAGVSLEQRVHLAALSAPSPQPPCHVKTHKNQPRYNYRRNKRTKAKKLAIKEEKEVGDVANDVRFMARLL